MSETKMVEQTLFDEAVRVGNQSITEANRHMRINQIAVNSIADALGLMKTGRITQARDRLDRALMGITRLTGGKL